MHFWVEISYTNPPPEGGGNSGTYHNLHLEKNFFDLEITFL